MMKGGGEDMMGEDHVGDHMTMETPSFPLDECIYIEAVLTKTA